MTRTDPAAAPAASPPRPRSNPYALILLVVGVVALIVGGVLVTTGAALEHVVHPTDAIAGTEFTDASTPWLFVGAVAVLLRLAVAAVRWREPDGGA